MAITKWNVETDAKTLRRLGKLGEELGELSGVVARCVIQGIEEIDPGSGKTNRKRMEEEIADVLAQCDLAMEHFNLPWLPIHERVKDKKKQTQEWEDLCAPDTPQWPAPGDLVRYRGGSSALALHGEPHAGGWHGLQCMGGYTFYTHVARPSAEDRLTWAECAVKYRHKTLEEACKEAQIATSDVPASVLLRCGYIP